MRLVTEEKGFIMRIGMFGGQLHRTAILIERQDQYEVFNQVVNKAFSGIKHVTIEVYKHDDLYVVSLTYPLHSKGHDRMMRGLQDRGYNLQQLDQGGLHLMIDWEK